MVHCLQYQVICEISYRKRIWYQEWEVERQILISNSCFCSKHIIMTIEHSQSPFSYLSLRIYILFRTCCIEEYGFYNELSHSQNPNYKITRTFPAPLLVAGVISKEDGWNWLIYYMVSMDHVKKQQNQIFDRSV